VDAFLKCTLRYRRRGSSPEVILFEDESPPSAVRTCVMLLWRGFPLRREPAPDCGRYFPKCLRLDASGLRDHERLATNPIVRKGRIQRHASQQRDALRPDRAFGTDLREHVEVLAAARATGPSHVLDPAQFLGRDMIEVTEDHESVTFFASDVVCEECAGAHGIL
jgi:hypothetical protein